MTAAPDSMETTREDSLTLEVELEASAEQVWRALSEPELLAAWLEPDAIGPDRGGPIECEPIEAEEGRSIRYAWRGGVEARPLDTEVLFEIAERPTGGVRLVITHSGFTPAVASGRVVSLAAHRRRRALAALCGGVLKWAA